MHNHVSRRSSATIGRYRVVERIGHGAMGEVYEAIDEDIGRRVAIRVMPPGQDNGVTGQVTHPNVVTVFDRGHDHGRPYLVMELLDGLTLPEYLQRPQGIRSTRRPPSCFRCATVFGRRTTLASSTGT